MRTRVGTPLPFLLRPHAPSSSRQAATEHCARRCGATRVRSHPQTRWPSASDPRYSWSWWWRVRQHLRAWRTRPAPTIPVDGATGINIVIQTFGFHKAKAHELKCVIYHLRPPNVMPNQLPEFAGRSSNQTIPGAEACGGRPYILPASTCGRQRPKTRGCRARCWPSTHPQHRAPVRLALSCTNLTVFPPGL